MAKALAALTLGLCIALSAFAAAADKKPPDWSQLTPEQQQILAPLSSDWNNFDEPKRKKWLLLAKRYPKMKPEAQKRVDNRMQRWAKLTPAQRWEAREQYRSIGKVAPNRRDELRRHWAEYQALPPHEKRMFDVPPSYVPPAERRKRTTSPKKNRHPAYVLPASL